MKLEPETEHQRESAREFIEHPYARELVKRLDKQGSTVLQHLLSAARISPDAKVAAIGREYEDIVSTVSFLKGRWREEG